VAIEGFQSSCPIGLFSLFFGIVALLISKDLQGKWKKLDRGLAIAGMSMTIISGIASLFV